jgi:hypothetical protein
MSHKSGNTNLQLLSMLAQCEICISAHDNALIFKCRQFGFEYCLSILANIVDSPAFSLFVLPPSITVSEYSWFQTFAVFCMLYVFFWVIPRRLNFICRRFGTLFYLHRQVGKQRLNLRMVGVSIWERVWLKNSLSQLEGGWRGRGGSVYKAGCENLMTHIEMAGGYVS